MYRYRILGYLTGYSQKLESNLRGKRRDFWLHKITVIQSVLQIRVCSHQVPDSENTGKTLQYPRHEKS
jgi:hypothetical protein